MDKVTTIKDKEICLVAEKEVGNLVDLCECTELDEVSISKEGEGK